jgi:hypothetical protein
MSTYFKNTKSVAASWILKSLYTNDLWFDEAPNRKKDKNYLYIPLFDIAQESKKFDLITLKEACYFLQKNSHVNIWGDDFDSSAMLVQISEEGIEAYKKAFYGKSLSLPLKKIFAAASVILVIIAITTKVQRYSASNRFYKYQPPTENKNRTTESLQKTTASIR